MKRGKTRDWVKRRNEKGLFSNLVKELSIEDTSAFKEMMRMNYEDFLQVLGYIERDITPKPINGGHEVIPPKARLTVTLRFLATGETFRSLSFQFRSSKAAISYIVMEVCTAIFKNMAGQFLRTPETAGLLPVPASTRRGSTLRIVVLLSFFILFSSATDILNGH